MMTIRIGNEKSTSPGVTLRFAKDRGRCISVPHIAPCNLTVLLFPKLNMLRRRRSVRVATPPGRKVAPVFHGEPPWQVDDEGGQIGKGGLELFRDILVDQ